ENSKVPTLRGPGAVDRDWLIHFIEDCPGDWPMPVLSAKQEGAIPKPSHMERARAFLENRSVSQFYVMGSAEKLASEFAAVERETRADIGRNWESSLARMHYCQTCCLKTKDGEAFRAHVEWHERCLHKPPEPEPASLKTITIRVAPSGVFVLP